MLAFTFSPLPNVYCPLFSGLVTRDRSGPTTLDEALGAHRLFLVGDMVAMFLFSSSLNFASL